MTVDAPAQQAEMQRVRFDLDAVRRDFPALHQEINGHPLAYLDNAATALKPQAVLDAVAQIYGRFSANVHRGVHTLSQKATEAYEGARDAVAGYLGAADRREVVFLRGATEGINLVARSFLRPRLGSGDEILLSAMEHHSNIVPWQLVAEEVGARIRVIPMSDAGELDLQAFAQLLGPRTRMLALSHVSNALGTVNPVGEMCAAAREQGVPVIIDGAQAAPHGAVDVQALGCDFYVISGHKLYGPTGIGALWGRRELLETMPPYQGGGEMIRSVSFEGTEYADLPHKFEAGTPHIAGAVGLGAAVRYMESLDPSLRSQQENDLLSYATEGLQTIPQVRLVGTAAHKVSLVSFVVEGIHAHDLGTILDQEGIAVRAGHHCAQPALERLGYTATARASFAFYNSRQEVDRLLGGLRSALEIFAL